MGFSVGTFFFGALGLFISVFLRGGRRDPAGDGLLGGGDEAGNDQDDLRRQRQEADGTGMTQR